VRVSEKVAAIISTMSRSGDSGMFFAARYLFVLLGVGDSLLESLWQRISYPQSQVRKELRNEM